MFYCLKKVNLKRVSKSDFSQGFTLIELLMAIAIMAVTASAITYALSWMLTSNQNLDKEQSRRVEATRALDLITSDIRISNVVDPAGTSRTAPTGVTGTVVLDMDMESAPILGEVAPTACATPAKNRIVYSVKTDANGHNILYRHGLVSNSDGKIDCSKLLQTTDGDKIADALAISNINQTIPVPSCGLTTAPGTVGFYACKSANKISLAVYVATQRAKNAAGNYVNTKTYGTSRTIVSGESIPALASSVELCSVPTIIGDTKTVADGDIGNTKSTDTTKNLIPNAIKLNFDNSANTVLTQIPSPNTQIPCDGGLVTYTY